MGKKNDARNTAQSRKADDKAAKTLKKHCATCGNTGKVRVAPPRGGRSARQQYYPPTEQKCPDC